MKISVNHFDSKALEWHEKCTILLDVNGQKEKCGCQCNINTLPPFSAVAELKGDDADAFLRYDDRDLDEKETESLKKAHEVYKRANK